MSESAVEFESVSRVHIGLAVRDVEESVAFYRLLLGQEPSKRRGDYAKFEVVQPPLNLSMVQSAGATSPANPVSHYGIQVKSTQAVQQMAERLKAAGAPVRIEDEVTCCYARQNKAWTSDPDGNKWEIFIVLGDEAAESAAGGSCCAPPEGGGTTRQQPGAIARACC